MIVILFAGGLGNQMFQYAMARNLSLKNNLPLKFNYSHYPTEKADTYKDIRNFGLNNFNIVGDVATENEVRSFFKYYKDDTWARRIRFWKLRLFPELYYRERYMREPPGKSHVFDPHVLTHRYKGDICIQGFWASEKYFAEIRDVIVKDLSVRTEPNEYNTALLEEVDAVNSVSLHFRRGNNTDPKNPFGLLSFDYYRKAIGMISKQVKNPKFFVFSDDIEWVKNNFVLDYPAVFVTNPVDKDYEDMRLMSHCKYHIIANSTFSWWGAWLSEHPGKIIIAPERYAQNLNRANPDYYPDSWILI